MRSYKDTITKALLNVEVGEENVMLEIEEESESKDILIDKGEGIACAFFILQESLESTEEIEELCKMLKERLAV